MLRCTECNKELVVKDKILINNGEDIKIIYKCENKECNCEKVINSEDYI